LKCCVVLIKKKYNKHSINIEIVKQNSQKKKILMPLPRYGFDPSEVTIAWKTFTDIGINVTFATPTGQQSAADQLVLDGYCFGLMKAIPEVQQNYLLLLQSLSFISPISYEQIEIEEYDGLYLTGGHDVQMLSYLDNALLHKKIVQYWSLTPPRPIAAVCHGVLLLARCQQDKLFNGKGSILQGKKVTCVRSFMERMAYFLSSAQYGSYHLSTTNGDYTENEVRQAVGNDMYFVEGSNNYLQLIWIGNNEDHTKAHIVEDGNLLTARWPADVWFLAKRFAVKLYE